MKKLGEPFQVVDWKTEKYVPVIERPESVKSGLEKFEIKVSVEKEISHSNTAEHHIRWIQIFFHPQGEQNGYQLANCEFTAHRESVEGASQGPACTVHTVTVTAMINKPGIIYVLSFCDIHGLWENTREVKIR